ncbi:DUF2393 family protein [Campylobacter sp. RM12327]|uniref:DUF2393 family protein n=1 Tax=Campylobacter sputorum TaxID=206 RepID=UPI000B798DDF|nr:MULTISPECIES: DUF2393 family protein [Campylobacter]ASM39563.1 DUF2393 domain protein [Campylobacter sputorum]MBE7358816.1 DUF2393 family protein [Campylobacter sp. RM11302]MBF6669798.1 DUF2393 family protein [Campylobacter sp. RM12327]MBF6675000.1 DUF2393 family protein [Campylobacter sp. RM13538]MBF6676566.1 DUF2393 family protein [Campylobacter sp. RM12321]
MKFLNQIKEFFVFYLDHWYWIDFASIVWIVILLFLLILFSITIFTKTPLVSVFLLMISFLIAIFSIFYVNDYVDNIVRKRDTSVVLTKEMKYSDILLVDVNLTNLSKHKFKYCSIKLKFIKDGKNFIQNFIYKFNPIYTTSQKISSPLDLNETRKINFLIKNFGYKPSYKIMADSECF